MLNNDKKHKLISLVINTKENSATTDLMNLGNHRSFHFYFVTWDNYDSDIQTTERCLLQKRDDICSRKRFNSLENHFTKKKCGSMWQLLIVLIFQKRIEQHFTLDYESDENSNVFIMRHVNLSIFTMLVVLKPRIKFLVRSKFWGSQMLILSKLIQF